MLVMGAALRNIPSAMPRSRRRRERLDVAAVSPDRAAAAAPDDDRRRLARGAAVTRQLLADLHHDPGRPGQRDEHLAAVLLPAGFQYNNLAYGALIGNVMVVIATIFGVLYVRVAARRTK